MKRQPQMSDLRMDLNVQCSLEGSKGVVFKPNHEPQSRQPSHLAFWCDSGFVPFRKRIVADPYPWHHRKVTNSSQLTSDSKGKWYTSQKNAWKLCNGCRQGIEDARDPVYLFSTTGQADGKDFAKLPKNVSQRPNTVASSHCITAFPSVEENGYRRVYTAVQRSKTEQVRARRACLVGEGFSNWLSKGVASSMAVKQLLPSKSTVLQGSPNTSIRGSHDIGVRLPHGQEKLPNHIDRPMKREGGHYRPFSRTVVKTPEISLDDSSVNFRKDQRSAETFKQIMNFERTPTMHNRPTPTRETSVRLFHTKSTVNFLHFDDTHTHLLQSVIDVNQPPSRMSSARTAISIMEREDGLEHCSTNKS